MLEREIKTKRKEVGENKIRVRELKERV